MRQYKYTTILRSVFGVGLMWLAGHMPEVFAQVVARKLRGEL
jgi:hypothetical protein